MCVYKYTKKLENICVFVYTHIVCSIELGDQLPTNYILFQTSLFHNFVSVGYCQGGMTAFMLPDVTTLPHLPMNCKSAKWSFNSDNYTHLGNALTST